MRTVKFRGKALFGGEWKVGSLITCANGRVFIVEAYEYVSDDSMLYWEVDPATVGQYTGLTDQDGKEIYEGDIISWGTQNQFSGVAVWEDSFGCFIIESSAHLFEKAFKANVIGNIHDNPELLK